MKNYLSALLNRIKNENFTPVIFLTILVSILFFCNFTKNSFLSGWDTLHPEFNFSEYIKRTVFGSYEPYQGLGATSSQSHAGTIPLLFFLIPLSAILPINLIRYGYLFIAMLAGTIGMYYFLLFLTREQTKNNKQILVAIPGAVFYILNIGTMQVFYNPLEMFTSQFAILPLFFLFANNYLKKQTTKNLFFFSLIAFFSSLISHTPTSWYLLLFFFVIFLLFMIVTNWQLWQKALILLISLIVINLYWILPNLYFIQKHGYEVKNSQINTLFSNEAFLKNVEYSDLKDILTFKSFNFDWKIYDFKSSQFVPLLNGWVNHLKTPLAIFLAGFYVFLTTLGIIYALRKKVAILLSLAFIFLLSIFLLLTTSPPFGWLFSILQKTFPLFQESLRLPFTKVSPELIFFSSVFFAFGVKIMLSILERLTKTKIASYIFIVLTALSIIWYMQPAFKGNFIDPKVRVEIPKEYFMAFQSLKDRDTNGKIAILPAHSLWGWNYYNWGYQGAGFLWFGIKQPILEREFDRWSTLNEQYYREWSYALYSNNEPLLLNVLKKYNIKFIFYDKTLIAPGADKEVLLKNDIKKLLNNLKEEKYIKNEMTFNDKIVIYEINMPNSKLINTVNDFSPVKNRPADYYFNDFIFNNYGNYTTDNNNRNGLLFPFQDLIGESSKINPDLINIKDNNLIFTNPFPDKVFNLNSAYSSTSLIPSYILAYKKQGELKLAIYPRLENIDGNSIDQPLEAGIHFFDPDSTIILNDNDSFDLLKIPENTPFYLGETFLKPKNNLINLYSNNSFRKVFSNDFLPTLKNCAENESVDKNKVDFRDSEILIKGKSAVCISFSLQNIADKETPGEYSDVLVKMSFTISGGPKIKVCLNNNSNTSCQEELKLLKDNNNVTFSFPINRQTTKNLFMEFTADKQNTIKASITNIALYKQNSVYELNFDALPNTPTKFNDIKFKTINVPIVASADYNIDVAKADKLNNDCGQNSLAQKEVKDNIIKYTSNNGSFCDHFSYSNLPHNQAYLILIKSKNEIGLPLTVCLTNYTSKRCDLYSKFHNNKLWQNDIFLIPPMDPGGLGYDLNIENVGIKNSPAINYLASIQFIPIPYDFLENIKSGDDSKIHLAGKIESLKEYNPLLFLVKTDSHPLLLNLDYSYEPGFKAYKITCNNKLSCLFRAYFAPFTTKSLGKHVIVNGWSNGWLMEENGKTNNSYIVIAFLPQYLEYFGFLLLVVYFSYLTYKLLPKTKKN